MAFGIVLGLVAAGIAVTVRRDNRAAPSSTGSRHPPSGASPLASPSLSSSASPAGAGSTGPSPAVTPSLVPSPAVATGLAAAAATHFLDTYVDAGGRVVRTDQGGDTVSEGQAYAMLLAVATGDRSRFGLVWGWTQANLQRSDGLLSWHWQNGKVVDPTPAADADLDAARALLLAAQRFGVASYRQQALRIGASILAEETVTVGGQPVLVAGPWAQSHPSYVDPSYFSPQAFALLGAASGDVAWGQLAASSYRVLGQLTGDSTHLPPDWSVLGTGGVAQASAAPGAGGSPTYGFDAARTLVWMAEDCTAQGRSVAAAAWPFLQSVSSGTIAAVYSLSGQPQVSYSHPVAEVAAAAAAQASGNAAAAAALLNRASATDAASPTYYGAAWVALGRILLTTTLLGGCAG